MIQKPLFFTDKNRNVILEAILGTPNAAIPDSLKPFEVLEPNTSDGAAEKHAPVLETNGLQVTISVGSVLHPMTAEHSITCIMLETNAGCMMRIHLTPDCQPIAHFTLEEGDSPKAAYAVCNLHGFWKTEA